MPSKIPETIYPCPFSKSYGIPGQQAWLILKIYFIYRFILACMLIILFHTRFGPSLLGSHDQQLFIISSGLFLLITLLSGIGIFWRLTRYTAQAQIVIFTDIIIITLIMHASGGITSGLGILLAVSTAAGGLLVGGRCAMFFAALASLAIMAEQMYAVTTNAFDTTSYASAGMLGAAFFTIALLSFVLAKRTEKTEQLATQRKQTISKLEKLNEYIIQHLQSGIIIFNADQQVSMANATALDLLGFSSQPETLKQIEPQLATDFSSWRADAQRNFFFLQAKNNSSTEVQIHFQELPASQETLYLIMLEDMAVYNQRLQQSKLASLGQLTASIAHEIRNPLGAISHAGQLLSECPGLTVQDLRLTDIIQTHSLRVNKIIEDILQLSKRSPSKREKISISEWLTDYLAKFILENDLEEQLFSLSIADQSLSTLIDPGHLKQILDNLCLNALKYGSPEQGEIIIRSYNTQSETVIEVIDSGSGIATDDIDHLFEPFFTTSSSGTGLGLYISRELAQLNQAKLSYHYTEHKQSCFRLSLVDANKNTIAI
jgi:two-component system sensor histidine kinase PilS (NtrC family)